MLGKKKKKGVVDMARRLRKVMELILAVVGPVLGGIISLGVFVTKKNSELMSKGFDRLHDSVKH
jgi:hypothetical protein